MKNKGIIIVTIVTTLILSVPLIAMQFSDDWDWKPFDFIIIGILIFLTGLAIDWAVRNVSKKYRLLVVIGIILGFLAIWAEMAVGALEQLFTGQLW